MITRSSTGALLIALLVSFVIGNRTGRPAVESLAQGHPNGTPASQMARNKLLKRDRETLAHLRAEGKTDTMLVFASERGKNPDVATRLAAVGALIRYREDEVDYLRAQVPLESVEAVASMNEIEVLGVDSDPIHNTAEDDADISQSRAPQRSSPLKLRPPDRNTPAENPYLATREIKAPQFIAKHPTFDGRGVTIGLLEFGIPDFLCPELQTATTLAGQPVRKLIDILDAYDPVDDGDNQLMMTETVQSANGYFTYADVRYKAPAEGHYQIGLVNEAEFNAKFIGKDFNLDGNPPGASRVFAVLWNKATNDVWVDTNQNQDFSDEKALSDYNRTYQYGTLGKDNPSSSTREVAAFMITADPRNNFIRFFPLLNSHATETTSSAAGRGFFGGRMNGAAPGAQIISIMNSFSYHGLIEGVILAMKNSKVDLITIQVASFERQKDGSSVTTIVWDRAVERYRKPIFIASSNAGPGINSLSEISSGSGVISVGGYVHRDTWRFDEGVIANKTDYVVNFSSRGPAQDGRFKPDLVTPSVGVYSSNANRPPFKGPYELPRGYAIGSGTSEATPMAAGAAALLISAAKQTGLSYDVDRLRRALKYTARFLPGYGPTEQGDGLIQVDAAWNTLQRIGPAVKISSRAPVHHVLSAYLRQPDEGVGIYERGGWTLGQMAERTIVFTRTSGPATKVRYAVHWVGNNGTFSSASHISLPLGTAVKLKVTLNPKADGVNSAILRLIDPADTTIAYEVMNTIIASRVFSPANGFSIQEEDVLTDYPGYKSIFFDVPEHAAAVKFEMTVVSGNLRMTVMDPTGNEVGLIYSLPRGVRPPHVTSGSQTRTITNPEPGVWEMIVVNHDFSDIDRGKGRDSNGFLAEAKQKTGAFTYVASVFDVQANAADRPQSDSGDNKLQVSFVNKMAAFVGTVGNTPLGSAFSERIEIPANSKPRIMEIDVPAGTQVLRAEVTTKTNDDVDLYLYECTRERCGVYEPLLHHNCGGDGCELKAFSNGPWGDESVVIWNPHPGKWKAVIDPVYSGVGTIECQYTDVILNPKYGEIRSNETRKFGVGDHWNSEIQFVTGATPEKPRRLITAIELLSEKPEVLAYSVEGVSNLTKNTLTRRVPFGTALFNMTNVNVRTEKAQ